MIMEKISKFHLFIDEFLKLNLFCLLSSSIIFLFQFIFSYIEEFVSMKFELTLLNIFLFSILIFIALLIEILILNYSKYKGNNIFSLEESIKSNKKPEVFKNIVIAFVCCLLTFFVGLSLGSEGPCVFMAGLLFYSFYRKDKKEDRVHILHIGGSVGFSLAFLNPLAGLSYYFEEFKEKINLLNLFRLIYTLSVSYILLVILKGSWTFSLFFNVNSFINPILLVFIPIFSILIYLCSFILRYVLIHLKKFSLSISANTKVVIYSIVLISVISLKFFFNQGLGSGSNIINNISSFSTIDYILILLIVRLIFLLLSFNSNLAGGTLIPILSIGILIGKCMFLVVEPLNEFSKNDEYIFVLTIMLCFYGSYSKNFLTSSLLAFSFANPLYLFPMMIIVLPIPYFLSKIELRIKDKRKQKVLN